MVYGYARMIAPVPAADDVIENLFEAVWSDYIGEDEPDITDRMKEIAEQFCAVMHQQFEPWVCEPVASESVNVKAWIVENRPDWLKQ